MISNPLIFLDIDGVLNSFRTAVAFDGCGDVPPNYQAGMRLMRAELKLDPVAIGLIRALCTKADAGIVISSTWRINRKVSDFTSLFAAYGWLSAPVVGLTPRGGWIRGYEIRLWLADNNAAGAPYVIFDDDGDFYPDQPLIKTDAKNGLQYEDYKRAASILGIEP